MNAIDLLGEKIELYKADLTSWGERCILIVIRGTI